MSYSILLADDHAVVRQGLHTLLEMAGYRVVAEAASGERAVALWQEHRPDLTLLDLDMPGIGGLEALQRILTRDPNARVLIFSMHDDHIYASRSMQAGARGYIVKTEAPENMLEAVHKVMRGGCYITHHLAQQLAMSRVSGMDDPINLLSPREFEVFRRIAEGRSLTEIASQLNIGYKTAANIQTHVRQKLDVQTTGQLVHLAIRYGILQQHE